MLIKRPMNYTPKNEERMLHIWLPDSYDSDPTERYPVMYFFDGHNLFRDQDATYGKCWGLEAFLQTWQKDMIVVGIECSHQGNDRIGEYCPYDIVHFDFVKGPVKGMGEATMAWIVREIKLMIDREYRTWPGRSATAIGGSSMGGLMSLYAVCAWNQVFSKAACLSSAISACYADVAACAAGAKLDPDTRVYLSWGTEETGGKRPTPAEDWQTKAAKAHIALEALLHIQDVDVRLYSQRGGAHCEADWEKQVPAFMDYLWLEGDRA